MTSPRCLGRGPGARALRAESIDWVSPFPRRSARLPQKAAGPWATRRIAPTGNRPEHLVLALCPPVPWNQRRLMVSARKALGPGPGNRGKATFRWRTFIIRFERFPGFQASGSAGGHDPRERHHLPPHRLVGRIHESVLREGKFPPGGNGTPAPEDKGIITKKKKDCKPWLRLATPSICLVELRGIEPLAS